MKFLKKKITIILFHQFLKKNLFIVFIPNFGILKFDNFLFKSFQGTKYVSTKNSILKLPNLNILYGACSSKLDLASCVSKLKLFVGVKINTLYFEFCESLMSNYLIFLTLPGFLFNLKKFYFYFLNYFFGLFSKFKKI